jgi:hypothetical protein
MVALTAAQQRSVSAIQAELNRLLRYDDESIVHAKWVRQRYDCGCYASFEPARKAAVRTAWHEAGHAVAAMAVGARFSSASIHHGHRSEGRVHAICGGTDLSFVIDAAGQIGERLMDWTLPQTDAELQRWLAGWTRDGDARRFRRAIGPRAGLDEAEAWRQAEQLLTPHRTRIRELARALLVHPRHLPYLVAAELADWAASDGTGAGRYGPT